MTLMAAISLVARLRPHSLHLSPEVGGKGGGGGMGRVCEASVRAREGLCDE